MTDAPLLSTPGAAPPPNGHAEWLTAADGVRLRAAFWPHGHRGWAAVFQGRAEFIEKYYETIARLRGLGFSVAAIDWRGQGLSDRPLDDPKKGHVGDFLEYQRDVDAFLSRIRAVAGDNHPLVLFAHSMGGAVAARTLMRQYEIGGRSAGGAPAMAARAAVLSAPLLGFSGGPLYRAAAPTATRLATAFGSATAYSPGGRPENYIRYAPLETNVLTSDPHRYRRLQGLLEAHSELELGGATWGWARAALREAARLRPTPIPSLIALGRHENVVDPQAVRRFADRSPKGRLLMLAGARHEPFVESSAVQERLWSAVADFLDEHLV